MADKREDGDGDSQPVPQGRKVYRRPELREYGKVRELTAGGSGGQGDGASGMQPRNGPQQPVG